jgi:SAM-dependent methyltransferase
MPWDATSFDAAFSVHTIYFWSEPAAALGEIRRVLRPGGRFVLGMRERSDAALAAFPAPTYQFYSSEEASRLLAAAGLDVIENRGADGNAELRIIVARAR